MTLSPAVPLPTPTFQPPLLMTTGAPNVLVAGVMQSSCVTCVTRGGRTVVSTVVMMRCSAPVKAPDGVATVQPVAALLSRSTRMRSSAAGTAWAERTSVAKHSRTRTKRAQTRQFTGTAPCSP